MLSKLNEAFQAYIDFFLFNELYFPAVPVYKLHMTSAESYIPESTFLYKYVTLT